MKFTMSRACTVVSLSGRSVAFEKDVPTHVPDQMWNEVMERGGVAEDELPTSGKEEHAPPTGAARTEAIAAAIKVMVLRAAREEFTAAGAPHASVLSALTGFAVDGKERDAAWAAIQSAEQD